MTATSTKTEHRVRWYVYAGHPSDKNLIPRVATMRGTWAYEAKCSCGWETHTGGGLERYVRELVADHKFDVEHGFWRG